ncbi:MAG: glycosyltransferase family 39 protein [Bryobacteraceae bacterium]
MSSSTFDCWDKRTSWYRLLVQRVGWPLLVSVFLLVFGSYRIAQTWELYCPTYDEPVHIACGLEWWDKGAYTLEPQHPPLARIVLAYPLYAAGKHIKGIANWTAEGNEQIYEGSFRQNMIAVRRPMLLFFWLGGLTCFVWCALYLTPWIGALSVFLYALSPPVLGQAGIATTDIAITGTLPLAVLAALVFARQPSWKTGSFAGFAAALGLTSKMSFLLFYPAALFGCALAGGLRTWKQKDKPKANLRWEAIAPYLRAAGPGLAVFAFTVWAIYLFSVDDLSPAKGAQALLTNSVGWKHQLLDVLLHVRMPAGKLISGIGSVFLHFEMGHTVLFLGKLQTHGSVIFFPLIFAIKSPLAFVLLALLALVYCFRSTDVVAAEAAFPLLAGCMILMGCLPATLNLGVRHILPIYPLLGIAAAAALSALWNCEAARRVGRVAAIGLVGGILYSHLDAGPDYIPWFNVLAGSHPERIVVDSDLDLGQDLSRLVQQARDSHIDRLWLRYWGSADPKRHDLPPFTELPFNQPVKGWVAISINWAAVHADEFAWLDRYPFQPVGKTIRLYKIDP